MYISPMLLHKVDEPFNDDEWITELKLDGIRLILSKFNNKVRLYTRHKNEVTSKFPELLDINIPDGTVIDGEIIVSGDNGKPDFEAMMERFQSKKALYPIQFCVFDVVYYKGQKVSSLSLIERKQLLSKFLPQSDNVILVQWIEGNAEAYFNLVQQQDLEGIVMKRKDSKYQIDERSKDWLKVINYKYADVFITGLRKNEFGMLLSIEYDNQIEYAGLMEFMNPKDKATFYRVHKELIIGENKNFFYIKPQIKCRVKFRNYTKKGLLRIPSFVEYIS